MTNLFDTQAIAEVVKQGLLKLKEEYGFEDYGAVLHENHSKPFSMAVKNKRVILEVFISTREGFEILYRKDSWPNHKNCSLPSFLALMFKDDMKGRDEFLSEFFAGQENYEPNSKASHQYSFDREIDFIKKYFPQVLEGKFDVF